VYSHNVASGGGGDITLSANPSWPLMTATWALPAMVKAVTSPQHPAFFGFRYNPPQTPTFSSNDRVDISQWSDWLWNHHLAQCQFSKQTDGDRGALTPAL